MTATMCFMLGGAMLAGTMALTMAWGAVRDAAANRMPLAFLEIACCTGFLLIAVALFHALIR